MPVKKNFESIDTRNTRKAGNVEAAMSQATSKYGQQPEATEEEARQRRQNMKTQGRKGAKLNRINMGFTDDNFSFIQTVSRLKSITMTGYVNQIIEDYRKTHGVNEEALQQLKEIMDKIDAAEEEAKAFNDKANKALIAAMKKDLADKL